MKSRFHIAVLTLIIFGFIGIQFAAFIDDPDHIAEPDPDCPICIAAQTSAYLHLTTPTSFNLDILFYLIEKTPLEPHLYNYESNISIRAPPLHKISL